MDAGRSIVFFMKAAEDGMSDAEKAVSAPGGGGVPDTKTDAVEKTEPEGEAPSKTDGKEKEKACTCPEGKCTCGEKTAASAKDKAQQLAADAGRPTSTGIAAGASLGSLLAALGAMNRASDQDGEHSILSNPLLLGAAGAGAGYIGGNLVDSIKTTNHRTDGGILPILLDAAGVGSLTRLGGKFLSEDRRRALTAAAAERSHALDAARRSLIRQGFSDAAVDRILADRLQSELRLPADIHTRYANAVAAYRKAFAKVHGLPETPSRGVAGAVRDIAKPATGAIERLKALLPMDKKWSVLRDQIGRHLLSEGSTGPFRMRNLLNRSFWTANKGSKALALASLAGLGHLGYRIMSDD